MDVIFLNNSMATKFNSFRALAECYGDNMARRIRSRLDDLRAAPNLSVMRELPGCCHELKHDRAGQLALDLHHPFKLIFEPANESVLRNEDSGLDWARVTVIRVLQVVNCYD